MAQDGEIDLKEVKAKYSVKDIRFVDSRELDFANEFRTTFEACFAIGLTLLGNVIGNFNWILFVTMTIFLLFGVFSYVRYFKKQKEIRVEEISTSTSPSKPIIKV